MDKCRKCGEMFKGIGKLCPDCEAEVCEKIDKSKKLFNRHGLEATVKYDIDNARFECTNSDGYWVSYNGENWLQAVPAKSLSVKYKPNPITDPLGKVETLHGFPLDMAEGFVKNDSGKLQWSLLPFNELKDVVKVLMLGAKKYTPDNWKKCDDVTRYKDALMRHIISYISGETEDDESHLSHLAHAICNCLFLMYFDNTKEEKK